MPRMIKFWALTILAGLAIAAAVFGFCVLVGSFCTWRWFLPGDWSADGRGRVLLISLFGGTFGAVLLGISIWPEGSRRTTNTGAPNQIGLSEETKHYLARTPATTLMWLSSMTEADTILFRPTNLLTFRRVADQSISLSNVPDLTPHEWRVLTALAKGLRPYGSNLPGATYMGRPVEPALRGALLVDLSQPAAPPPDPPRNPQAPTVHLTDGL